jgi:hypothetical protein
MRRKLTILGVCALVALGTILAFSNKKGRGRTAGTTHSLVVTQDGKLAVQLQPNERAKMTVVVNWSTPPTNTASSATKPGNK